MYQANGYLGFPTVASNQNMWKQFFIRLQVKGRRLNARWQERCARRRWLKREKRRRKAEQVGFLLNMYSSHVFKLACLRCGHIILVSHKCKCEIMNPKPTMNTTVGTAHILSCISNMLQPVLTLHCVTRNCFCCFLNGS